MTAEALAQIKARCEAATPGPWTWGAKHVCQRFSAPDGMVDYLPLFLNPDYPKGLPQWDRNADFAQNARTDIPALLLEIERLWGLLKQIAGDPYDCITIDELTAAFQKEPR
jgi:hypothetical protein